MKSNEYLIVHKSILPEYFEQVIQARELINDKNFSVSDACKQLNISRTTYYKYIDYIFRPSKNSGHKAIFVLKTIDEKGMLSQILKVIYDKQGNIISINQDTPLDGTAYITLAIDVSDLNSSIEQLKETMTTINGVKSVDIMGVE
jgi:chorismate mutase